MSRIVLEAEQDGASVVVWEGGTGHRVEYATEDQAANAALWLQDKAREIHEAKKEQGVGVANAYGESCTSYEIVRRYLKVCKRAGYRVFEDAFTRPPSEFW